ncbi:MAG: hypothetical protein RLZ44_76 [Pseudomonadota bacterium]
MSEFPVIRRAIPKRRYQVGEYGVTLLGEIESGDGVDYTHILAFVREGDAKPSLVVCAEPQPASQGSAGSYRLRLVNRAMSEVLDTADAWGDAERFTEEGLRVGMQLLGLSGETPYRLG